MNLYKLHSNPEKLNNFQLAKRKVPKVAWDATTSLDDKRKLSHLWSADPNLAFSYADATNQEFKEGEAAISKNPQLACDYATFITGRRFPAGEPAIATNAAYAFRYARRALRGRFPAGEPAIAKDSVLSYKYAVEIIKGRFPDGEPSIANDKSGNSTLYAENILKDKDPRTWAVRYKKKHGLS